MAQNDQAVAERTSVTWQAGLQKGFQTEHWLFHNAEQKLTT